MPTSSKVHIDTGELVDVYSNDDNRWYPARIIDFYDNEIKIRYGDSDSDVDEWINILNPHTQIAPLHTNTLKCIPLEIPSSNMVISNDQTHCIYNTSHHNILLITINIYGIKTIHQYDITTNKWTQFAQYISSTSKINSIAMNEEYGILYIFGTGYSNYCPVLDTFNMNQRTLTCSKQIECINSGKSCNVFNPYLYIIPSPYNEVHLISAINLGKTTQYKINTNHIMEHLCSNLEFEAIFVTFCKDLNQIVAVNNFGSIYYCNLHNYEWNEMNIGIDVEIDACFAFLAYNHFLFMFVLVYDECRERQSYEIWFIDLMEQTIFKSHKKPPEILFEQCFLATMDKETNALHILFNDDDADIQHFKLHLMNSIPSKMMKYYQQKYCNNLIFGYVGEMSLLLSRAVPLDIIYLLLAFYPPFI